MSDKYMGFREARLERDKRELKTLELCIIVMTVGLLLLVVFEWPG